LCPLHNPCIGGQLLGPGDSVGSEHCADDISGHHLCGSHLSVDCGRHLLNTGGHLCFISHCGADSCLSPVDSAVLGRESNKVGANVLLSTGHHSGLILDLGNYLSSNHLSHNGSRDYLVLEGGSVDSLDIPIIHS